MYRRFAAVKKAPFWEPFGIGILLPFSLSVFAKGKAQSEEHPKRCTKAYSGCGLLLPLSRFLAEPKNA